MFPRRLGRGAARVGGVRPILPPLALAAALAGASFAGRAAIGTGGADGEPELFLEVWNGKVDASGLSYVRELNIGMDAFMTSPACYKGTVADLSNDVHLARLKAGGALPAGTVWAVHALTDDSFASLQAHGEQGGGNRTGLLTTVVAPSELSDGPTGSYSSFTQTTSNLKSHVTAFDTGGALVTSKAFVPADTGFYFKEGWWNSFMNSTVSFKSASAVETSAGIYFLTASAEDFSTGVIGRNKQSLGTWTFNGTQLVFATDAPASGTCPTRDQPCALPWGGTLAHAASVTAYSRKEDANCALYASVRRCDNGILSGSGDFASCSVPGVTPEPTPTPSPTPTPTPTPGPANGPRLTLIAPKSGDVMRVRVRHPMAWTVAGISPQRRLTLHFSRDGGQSWRIIRGGLRLNGYFAWKPSPRDLTDRGVMALCLPQTTRFLPVCSQITGTFRIVR